MTMLVLCVGCLALRSVLPRLPSLLRLFHTSSTLTLILILRGCLRLAETRTRLHLLTSRRSLLSLALSRICCPPMIHCVTSFGTLLHRRRVTLITCAPRCSIFF